jgi:hypothetical protein
MPNVFVSYSASDRKGVTDVVNALRSANITGWMDAADVAAGANLSSAVREALRAANAIIVFISPNSLKSEWVQFEVGAADALGKVIIPVVISGNYEEDELPEILKERRMIDARNRDQAEVVREIGNAIQSAQ